MTEPPPIPGATPRVETTERFDVAVIGAGAAGILACLAKRGTVTSEGTTRNAVDTAPRVALLDSMEPPGRKILISGGGRCNLTNESVTERDFVTRHPRPVRSLLCELPPSAVRRLFADLAPEFDAQRLIYCLAVAFRFARNESLDTGEISGVESRNVTRALFAAVCVDRVDLHPKAVVPVGAARLGQPCADGNEEQYE